MAFSCTLILMSCLVVLGRADTGNPGAVVRITQKGLDYARQIGINVLQQKLSSIQLPDYSGSYDVGFLGSVDYHISGMAITSVQLPSSQIVFVPNVGLKVSIDQAFIAIHGNWGVKYLFVSDSGDFDLQVLRISISVGLSLGSDGSGRPTVSTSDCSANIGDMKVHFTDTIDWLVNLFDDAIASSLRQTMQNQICPQVIDAVNNHLQPVLQSLPVSVKLDHVAAIDYSLTGPPTVTPGNLDVHMKGEVFEIAHRATPPFSPPPLSLPEDHNLMVYFAVSDYLFNTAGYVYQSAGKLVFNVTDDMVPKGSPMRLNTSAFGILIPQLEKMYPDMLMKLVITSHSAPSLNINPGNVSMAPLVDIQAYAILPNSSLAPLFLLNLKTDVFANVAVNSSRIVGNLKLSRVDIELKHSDVGPFSVGLIQTAVNFYLSSTLLPKVNEKLNEGIPLPLLDHVQLENIILKQYEHYLLLGADVHYG
ncbi:bactericidal permeability-increasing protein-like [Rana temporaria]|uniref:bactericidal permeability-increasing protein-like n=1 Tax=Rana temporaria TaxID=8407 RepID=UPI001AACE807|nr:bactericidal permeability-increasing protein-like [Rana temporaria]